MKVRSSIKSLKKRSQSGLQVICRRSRTGKKRLYVLSKVGGKFKARQG